MPNEEETKVWDDEEFSEKRRPKGMSSEETGAYLQDANDEKTEYQNKPRRTDLLAWLVVFRGKRNVAKFDLTADDFLIGRAQYCDIRLDDDEQELSRLHGRIRYDDTTRQFMYFDCGSANGSRINGEETLRAELHDSDRIAIGPYEIVFKRV